MRNGFRVFVILTSLVVSVSVAAAAPLVVKLDSKGTSKTLAVPAGYSGGTVTAYVLLNGNETQYVNFSIGGPTGAKVQMRSIVSSGNVTKDLAKPTKSWTAVNFISSAGKENPTLKVQAVADTSQSSSSSTSSSSSSNSDYCYGHTLTELEAVVEYFQSEGIPMTLDRLCAAYAESASPAPQGGSTPAAAPSGNANEISSEVLLHKNTCGVKANGVYLLRFDISLSGVSASDMAAGFTLYLSALDVNYGGSKAATLKPSSDGKYGPQPLILMSSTGGNEQVNVVKWSGAKASIVHLKVQDYVFYRGLSLARILAGSALSGGMGSVEIQSSSAIYSVCFSLTRSRQSVNGYPK